MPVDGAVAPEEGVPGVGAVEFVYDADGPSDAGDSGLGEGAPEVVAFVGAGA